MNATDPTMVVATSETGFGEEVPDEVSVEMVAQWQAYEAGNGRAAASNGNGTHAMTESAVAVGAEPSTTAAVGVIVPPGPIPAPVIPIPPPGPIPPIPVPILPLRTVSGRYRSTGTGFQLELRVDVDGKHPTRRVSGDYYTVSGATVNYFGSFVVDAPVITLSPGLVTITGTGRYTWSAAAPKVKITIPRVLIVMPAPAATLQHLTLSNTPGATYVCPRASAYFRTLDLEQDYELGVTPFASYNTGLLPSGGAARALSVVAAYGEAGIEMRLTSGSDAVNAGAEAGASWSNAELHASMVRHFSVWADLPQWKVWLFHAKLHDLGPGLLGIMFDQAGRQRQGAAVFYNLIAGTLPGQQREQLYTCVHELGHCFNLFHSFQKEFMTPPQPNRPSALSWMNYPQSYPSGGSPGFWAAFPFEFDTPELIHLRHAFRDNVIMGGNPFGIGAALEDPQEWGRNPLVDESGLRFEISAARSVLFGAPLTLQLTLRNDSGNAKRVHTSLKPEYGFVEVAIRQPGGQIVIYKPLLTQCIADDTVVLEQYGQAITDGALIHYGQDGHYFQQPGAYQVRALYYALDGSLIFSNVLDVRVRNPLNETDEQVSELFMQDEVGTLLYLVGSDAESLRAGNAALEQVRTQFADHPLAAYAQLAQGVNALREFKTVTPDGTVTIRKPRTATGLQLLSAVIDPATLKAAVTGLEGPGALETTATRGNLAMLADSIVEQTTQPNLAKYCVAQRATIAAELGDTELAQ